MADRTEKEKAKSAPASGGDALKQRIDDLVAALGQEGSVCSADEIEHLVAGLERLFRQRQDGEGSRSDVRDRLAEVLFGRLKSTFSRAFADAGEIEPTTAAKDFVGLLVTSEVCRHFATALERMLAESGHSSSEAFSFAGLTDFISVVEVMQLLGSGKHTGCLLLENAHNRIEVWLASGRVSFLNPARVDRRILNTGRDSIQCREVPQDKMEEAVAAHAKSNVPLAVWLAQHKLLRDSEVRDACRLFGCEVLYGFLHEEEPATFRYKRVLDMPEYAIKYDLRLGITPILLESSKRHDDLSGLLKVFPDPDEIVRLQPDMFVRLGGLNLTPLELKMLAWLNEGVSPCQLGEKVGLPLFDVLLVLVRLAREGVVDPPGGLESLLETSGTMEESLELAFEALDANDDQQAMASALDKAFGFGELKGPKDDEN